MAKSLVHSCFASVTLLASIALATPIDVGLNDPVNSGPPNTPLTIPYALSAPGELGALVNAGPTSIPLTIPYLLQSPSTDVGERGAAGLSLEAVVPSAQVPEPEPIFLFAIALLGMASMRLFPRRTAQEE